MAPLGRTGRHGDGQRLAVDHHHAHLMVEVATGDARLRAGAPAALELRVHAGRAKAPALLGDDLIHPVGRPLRKLERPWSMTLVMDRVHRPTWLCPDAASRERLLDMDERLKRPRAVAFALIAVGIGAAVPLIGWWGLGLLLVAVLGFRL